MDDRPHAALVLPDSSHPRAGCMQASPPIARCRECGAVDRSGFDVSELGARERLSSGSSRRVTLELDGFAWEKIDEEAAREGLEVERLVEFALLYYLADVDSGRIARRVSRSPYGGLKKRSP